VWLNCHTLIPLLIGLPLPIIVILITDVEKPPVEKDDGIDRWAEIVESVEEERRKKI